MSAPSFILVIIFIIFIIKPPITYTNTITDLNVQTLVTPMATVFVSKMNTLFHNLILIIAIFPNSKLFFINHGWLIEEIIIPKRVMPVT